jgi:DNA-binding MarR family transcriptional regulator
LAAHIGLSPSQASGVFESLRAKGLLASEPGVQDRRRQSWHITTAGQQRTGRLGERLAPLISRWKSSLSRADQQTALSFFQRLAAVDVYASDTTAASSASQSDTVQEAA